jgi:hypothetical protein
MKLLHFLWLPLLAMASMADSLLETIFNKISSLTLSDSLTLLIVAIIALFTWAVINKAHETD